MSIKVGKKLMKDTYEIALVPPVYVQIYAIYVQIFITGRLHGVSQVPPLPKTMLMGAGKRREKAQWVFGPLLLALGGLSVPGRASRLLG